MFARIIAALIRALFGIVTLPFRALGWQPRLQAADVAAAAVETVRADPIPAPAPTPSRQPTPIADLVKDHARRRIYTHEDRSHLVPLPDALQSWLSGLDTNEALHVIGCNPLDLQRHINAGLQGSTAPGPYRLPPVLPDQVRLTAKKGASGGTGGPSRGQDLSAALEELGLVFERSYGGPRR